MRLPPRGGDPLTSQAITTSLAPSPDLEPCWTQDIEEEATRSAAERGAEALDYHLSGCTARTRHRARHSSAQHLPFKPRAGPTRKEVQELLEEHCFEFDLALLDTNHRKHHPLSSPRLAGPHAATLRPWALANPPICLLRAGRPSRPSASPGTALVHVGLAGLDGLGQWARGAAFPSKK